MLERRPIKNYENYRTKTGVALVLNLGGAPWQNLGKIFG